ncbi:MAG: hypothetical protein OXL37_16275 [Chloroflexota bacterium]|nr:hypothetical protein [Chloroflexota bacterium]MDE2961438.1 hypothetical protein [Chloroflexota bacterium]
MLTPMEALDAATTHIQAGRIQDGARLAYVAAFQAVANAARRHKRRCKTLEDARKFVCWLDGLPTEPDDPVDSAPLFDWDEDGQPILLPIPEFIGAFDVAEEFKRHAEAPTELTSWQPDEYAFYLPAIRWLVEELETAQPRDPSVWMR